MGGGIWKREADLVRREGDVTRREADVTRREIEVTARETVLAERMKSAEGIIQAADERDARADARDAAADKRERDLDLHKMIGSQDVQYGEDWQARRQAGLDRLFSKGDREASHDDRVQLTEGPVEDDPGSA